MTPLEYDRFGGTIAGILAANAKKLDRAAAIGLRPKEKMLVSEWAARFRRFPDDDAYPGPWRHSTAPYLVEIMDALSPEDPCEEVPIKKCAQSGGSASAENWIGFISDMAPGPMLFVQATLQAAWDWAAEKFWPMVEATPRLAPEKGGTIKGQGLPDGDGSTKKKIKFAQSNGYVLLAGANSAASLRQRTVRYVVEDDLDQFPDDLEGQGSPEVMIDNRLKVFRRQGLSKRLKISTPTIKGASKIGAAYDASDRRRFYVKCPHCGDRFDLTWELIRWPDGRPEEAHVIPPCCGAQIEHWQKNAMSRPDGWASIEIDGEKIAPHLSEEAFQAWRARMPRSRKRGFHITGEITSFQTWADMAVRFIAAQGDLNRLKAFTNLERGEEFELRGGAPDHELLKELKEQHWGAAQMPIGPVAVTIGVDVQGDGVYVEKVGWGENAENWTLDARFLPGATDVPGEGAWIDLDRFVRTPVAYPGGREYAVDQVVVDAGYHTEAAQAFCKAHANRLAVYGRAGWTLPVLGRGENFRYVQRGKRAGQASKRAEDKAYIVGTFGVKLSFYGYLRTTLQAAHDEAAAGLAVQPRGRCHFNRDLPDAYFEQLTSETIVTKTVNGHPRREWAVLAGRQNHWLDCRVYNTAAAEKLMLDTLTDAQWAGLRAERYAAKNPNQGDLLAGGAVVAAPAKATPSVIDDKQPPASGFLKSSRKRGKWLER